MEFRSFNYDKNKAYDDYVLGADVGGTNTSIGIAGLKGKKPELLFSFKYKTKELPDLSTAIEHSLESTKSNYNIIVKKACIAVAGVVKNNTTADTQNIKWNVNAKSVKRKTKLSKVSLINDFQAIGYGINLLKKKDIVVVNKGIPEKNSVKAIIGAGTGLGKSILFYDKESGYYTPLPTEGGHEDIPVQSKEGFMLIEHIKKMLNTSKPISYEMVLSGPGLERIYDFVKQKSKTKLTKEIESSKEISMLISKYRKKDSACKKAYEIFTRVYAKAARNFALTTLCYGGLYIAGGIAEKNSDMFDEKFMSHFKNNYIFSKLLKKIPVYVIKNYDISLYGSVLYAALKI